MNNTVVRWLIYSILAILLITCVNSWQWKQPEPLTKDPIRYEVSGPLGNDFDTANKNNIVY